MPGDRTAILLFSHRPEREWQNKWFVQRDYTTNRQVAETFYEHTREAVAESGLPVLEVTGAQQRGDSFGARLANAVADAFAAGYDRVIAVGSDCPTLHKVEWGSIADQLAEGMPVLGPTPDETGTYLIGVTRSQFDRQAFAALPWKTSRLFESLRRHLTETAGAAPALLSPREDVNGPADLRRLLRRSSSSAALITRLRQVLRDIQWAVQSDRRPPTRPALTRRSRAPPSSLTSNCPR